MLNKVTKYYFIVFLITIVNSVSSQNRYRKLYDTSKSDSIVNFEVSLKGIELNSSRNLIVVNNYSLNEYDTLTNKKRGVDILIINKTGDILDTIFVYRKGIQLRANQLVKIDSNNVVLFSTASDFRNINIGEYIYVTKINLNTKSMSNYQFDLGFDIEKINDVIYNDFGYTLLIRRCSTGNNCNPTILRLRNDFALLWQKNHVLDSINYMYDGQDLLKLNSNYYYLTSFISNDGHVYGGIYKLDSAGNIIKVHKYRPTNSVVVFYNSLDNYENDLIVSASITTSYGYLGLLRFDNDLNLINYKIDYTFPRISGSKLTVKDKKIYVLSSSSSGITRSVFSVYDLNFNKGWSRKYYDSLINNKSEISIGFTQLVDKNWMLYGYTYDGSTRWEDAYYMVVDSTGCLFDNCVSLNTDNTKYNDKILIYPNPTNGELNVYNPTNINIRKIQIIDSGGSIKMIKSLDFNQINIKDFNPGLFIMQLILDDGSIINYKFLKD